MILGQIEGFSAKHDVELIVWKHSQTHIDRAIRTSSWNPRVKVVSWAKSSSIESSATRLLRTISSVSSCDASPELFYYPPELDLRETLGDCDLAIYHYSFCHAWLRRKTIKSERKIVAHLHNIESTLFFERAKADRMFVKRWIHLLNAKKLEKNQLDLNHLVDEIWHLSPIDLINWQNKLSGKQAPQKLRPPTYSPLKSAERKTSFQKKYEHSPNNQKAIVGFIGGLSFGPNRESLEWILTNVGPLLLKGNFRGELWVVGRDASEDLQSLMSEFPFIRYMGFVEDLNEFWDSLSLMLVPHITGSGVRIKLLDALAFGVPVLANQNAISRIHPELYRSKNLIAAHGAEDWANKILELDGQLIRYQNRSDTLDTYLAFDVVYRDLA